MGSGIEQIIGEVGEYREKCEAGCRAEDVDVV